MLVASILSFGQAANQLFSILRAISDQMLAVIHDEQNVFGFEDTF